MAVTIQQIATLLEKTWNPLELCESLKEQREDYLKEIIDTKLSDQGFPKEANYKNIKWKLFCTHQRPFSGWAELVKETYIAGDSMDELKTFFSRNDDQKMYLSHLSDFKFEVQFEDTREEWAELHPTIKTVAEALEIDWYPQIIESELINNYEAGSIYEERLREKLEECGFPANANVATIDYSVAIRNKINFEDWAQIAIDRYITSTLSKFKATNMTRMYVENQQYLDMSFDIETPVEEWEEE